MTRQQAGLFVFNSLMLSLGFAVVLFGLYFQPGWANGWPGLPQRVVWPVGLTVVAFVIGSAAVVGSGAGIVYLLGLRRERVATALLVVWCVCGLCMLAATCWWFHHTLAAFAARVWP